MHPEFAKPRQAAAAAAAAAEEAPLPLSGLSLHSYVPLGHDVVGEGYLVASGLPNVTSVSQAGDENVRDARTHEVYAKACSVRDRDSYQLPPFKDLQHDMYDVVGKLLAVFAGGASKQCRYLKLERAFMLLNTSSVMFQTLARST